MLKFVLFIVLLFDVNFAFGAKNDEIPSCGIGKKCADGYYCSGAVGESESGVCVANGVSIVMCRFIDYFNDNIVRLLFIFASVFVGLYLFIGKMNFNLIAQILIGMSILVGASGLVASIIGDTKGLCGKKEALKCLENTTDNATLSGAYKKTKNIYNLTDERTTAKYLPLNSTTTCSPLGCIKANCGKYKRDEKTVGSTTTVTCEKQSGAESTWTPTNLIGGSGFRPSDCQAGFTIRCDAYVATYERDYFSCKSCNGNVFYAEAPSVWQIANCKALVKKDVKY